MKPDQYRKKPNFRDMMKDEIMEILPKQEQNAIKSINS